MKKLLLILIPVMVLAFVFRSKILGLFHRAETPGETAATPAATLPAIGAGLSQGSGSGSTSTPAAPAPAVTTPATPATPAPTTPAHPVLPVPVILPGLVSPAGTTNTNGAAPVDDMARYFDSIGPAGVRHYKQVVSQFASGGVTAAEKARAIILTNKWVDNHRN